MIREDEDALICDLAETYHIYDYRQLPADKVAVLSCGLREDSRIKMKLSGSKVPIDTLLLAGISDKLGLLLWSKTEDGHKNINRPQSIVSSLIDTKPKENETLVYETGEDFLNSRKELIRRGGEG